LPKFLIRDEQRRALTFNGFSFAGLDVIAHDLNNEQQFAWSRPVPTCQGSYLRFGSTLRQPFQ
jgi:hypothetical protein